MLRQHFPKGKSKAGISFDPACMRLLQRLTFRRGSVRCPQTSWAEFRASGGKKNERAAREKTKPIVSIFNTLVQLLTSEFRPTISSWHIFFAYDFWTKNVGAINRTLPCFSRRDESKHMFVNPERSKSKLDLNHVTSRSIVDRRRSICISIDSWLQGQLLTDEVQYPYQLICLYRLSTMKSPSWSYFRVLSH